MNPTTAHTYIRCINEIYVGDNANQWRMLHAFETEKRAKRWQRDQEKQRPGSVTVGTTPPPQVTAKVVVDLARDRKREIVRLIIQQAADRARDQGRHSPKSRPDSGLSGKTAQLTQAYVAPDHDGSSSSRKRSRTPARLQKRKGIRANSGVL